MKKGITFDKNLLKSINVLCLQVIVFLLPIHQKYIAPFIGLWLITSIVRIIVFKSKPIFNKANLLLILFYIFLGVGVYWSQNKPSAWFDLEVKMSLFIFPFLFLFLTYTLDEVKRVIKSLVVGSVVSFLILIYLSLINYQSTHNFDAFFYIHLSPFIHPSYLSFYINLSVFALLLGLNEVKFQLFSSKISMLTAIILIGFNFLLLSKIGIIVSLIMLFLFLLKWVITRKKYLQGIVIVMLSVISFVLVYQKSHYVKIRINEFVEGLTTDNATKTYIEGSSSMRFEIWKLSTELIKEKPVLGYGTGDVLDELLNKYEKEGFAQGILKKLNAHNQFFQVFIAVGFIGLLVFLSALTMSIITGIKQMNYYIIVFIFMSVFFMLPESLLENQAGTIFFGLFFALFNQKSLGKKQL